MPVWGVREKKEGRQKNNDKERFGVVVFCVLFPVLYTILSSIHTHPPTPCLCGGGGEEGRRGRRIDQESSFSHSPIRNALPSDTRGVSKNLDR
jgi:hypothetical protein